jgi:uncharacterized protein (TIGR02246 family)
MPPSPGWPNPSHSGAALRRRLPIWPHLAPWVLLLGAVATAACRPAAGAPEDPSKRMIAKVMESYAAAYRDNDPDALAALYADGAVLLPPGHEMVKGRDSVRAFWSRGMEAGFEMATVSIEVSGDAGYVVGRYYVPPDDQDDAETGKYIIALRRERGGIWRITADIWNADQDSGNDDTPGDSTQSPVALVGQDFETIAQRP